MKSDILDFLTTRLGPGKQKTLSELYDEAKERGRLWNPHRGRFNQLLLASIPGTAFRCVKGKRTTKFIMRDETGIAGGISGDRESGQAKGLVSDIRFDGNQKPLRENGSACGKRRCLTGAQKPINLPPLASVPLIVENDVPLPKPYWEGCYPTRDVIRRLAPILKGLRVGESLMTPASFGGVFLAQPIHDLAKTLRRQYKQEIGFRTRPVGEGLRIWRFR